MAVSGIFTTPCLGSNRSSLHQQHPQQHLSRSNSNNMFNSLKHKISLKERKSSVANNKGNLQYPAPQSTATRRPPPNIMDAPPAYSPPAGPFPTTVPMSNNTPLHPNNPFGQGNDNNQIINNPPTAAAPTSNSAEAPADDRYAFLSTFDTAFLIDDSGSMAGGRWRETGEALEAITPVCTAHDSDGIDVYFLNHKGRNCYNNITSAADVHEIFSLVRPAGMTPTGQRLRSILKPYIETYRAAPNSTKPLNLICITDGAASDDVESVVVWAAKQLDSLDAPAWQVGVQFFQVGRDPEATKDLEELDDELGRHGIRDMVDTMPFKGADGARLTGNGILKCVLGSVVRKLDRKTV